MLRSILLFLLFLLALGLVAPAMGQDRRRSRREPKSARPPPRDYDAIREKVRDGVRPRLRAWLDARMRILARCDRCGGAGVLSNPHRACPDCPHSQGLVRRQEFDPASVDQFVIGTGAGTHRPAYWSALDLRPAEVDGKAISAYLIDEIRVRGWHEACALVKVRTVGDPDGPWRPDVSFWFDSEGAWRARDPWVLPTARRTLYYSGRFPPRILEQPRHEGGAKEILVRMAHLLYPRQPGLNGRFRFIARCQAPGAERKAVFRVDGRLRGKFLLQRMYLPWREGKCGDVAVQRLLIETLLDDLMGEGLLPSAREYHLKREGSTILATGFHPTRYLEEMAITVDAEGRPASIVQLFLGQSRSIDLRYIQKGGRTLVSGWDRRVHGTRDSAEIRWRSDRPDWRPTHVKIVRPEGPYKITFSSH